MEQFRVALAELVPPQRLLVAEPLANHTTFRIGGPADVLILPASPQEVATVWQLAGQYGLPIMAFGKGSNILVLDGGIPGVVLKFAEPMSYMSHQEATLTVGAGAFLRDVASYAAQHDLTNLEFAVGIPGSLGGAVFMNAGAYEGEIGQVVSAVTVLMPNGELQRFTATECGFSYRHSVFQDNGGIICEVEVSLALGDGQVIRQRMQDYTLRRETKQPVEMPSAGSTFKRPTGNFAGTLIEQAGLKGLRMGGAQVSEKHAGFIINAGGATAEDVLALIQEVQRQVSDKFHIQLQPEVRVVGEKCGGS